MTSKGHGLATAAPRAGDCTVAVIGPFQKNQWRYFIGTRVSKVCALVLPGEKKDVLSIGCSIRHHSCV